MGGTPIIGYVVLTVTFRKLDKRWTAYCEELGTATFGRTLPEAKERIEETIILHLDTLDDVGERERFFKEHNIRFRHTKPRKSSRINVPIIEDAFVQPYVQPIHELVHA